MNQFKNLRPHGDWISNYLDGTLFFKGTYHEGIKKGFWLYHTIDGALIKKEFFL